MNRENIIFNIPKFKVRVTSRLDICTNRSYTDMHFHPEAEIVRVESGRICCIANGCTLTLDTGDVIFINGHTPHKIFPSEEFSKCVFMWFDTDFYTYSENNGNTNFQNFLKQGTGMPYFVFKNGENLKIENLISDIKSEFCEEKRAFELCIRAHFFEIAAQLCRLGIIADENVKTKHLSKVAPIAEYIDKNYKNKLLLNDIAKYANTDKYYLCKLFKNISGATVVEYINFVRLSHAQRLLESTSAPIAEIAFESGFSSVQYFNRVFKKYRDCSPNAYRKMNRKNC